MDGSALPECAELGMRADKGVLGTEFREGESSGFRRVCTCKPLFAEVSASSYVSAFIFSA